MIPYSGGDDFGAIVVDIGHHTTKMGFAGEDSPRAWFRSEVAVLRAKPKEDSGGSGDITKIQYDYLSRPLDPATGTDGEWETFNPVDPVSGLLRHCDDPGRDIRASFDRPLKPPLWTRMMSHGLSTSLLSSDSERFGAPVLWVERSYAPPASRRRAAEILFEQFSAPAVFSARDAVLACYACGRTTGTVVDAGDVATVVSPVFEGFVEARGVVRSPVGGELLDARALRALDAAAGRPVEPLYRVRGHARRGPRFHHLARLDVGRAARAATATAADAAVSHKLPVRRSHKLPDGTEVALDEDARRAAVGPLLGRDDADARAREEAKAVRSSVDADRDDSAAYAPPPVSARPLGNVVADAAFRCDRDQQAQLLSSVVLSGGGSCVEDLPDRLRDEVEGVIHAHTPGWRVKVLAPPPAERAISA